MALSRMASGSSTTDSNQSMLSIQPPLVLTLVAAPRPKYWAATPARLPVASLRHRHRLRSTALLAEPRRRVIVCAAAGDAGRHPETPMNQLPPLALPAGIRARILPWANA